MFCRNYKFVQKVIRNFNKCIIPQRNAFMKRNYCTGTKIDKQLLERYVNNIHNEYKILTKNKIDGKTEKRLREIIPLLDILDERKKLVDHLTSLNELMNEEDAEMKMLAKEEKEMYQNKILAVEQAFFEALLVPEPQDLCDSIILEVNAGVGGQEAMLFARELYEMYWNYAEYKGWSCELAEMDTTDIGGLRHCSTFIQGPDVFRHFKYEAGVHRVQRIPATEKSGRLHTSTVSVVALPQPKDVDVTIHDKDLKIETKRSSGAGGQHVNTTDSAVRIVHLPTGIAVECQVDRSQIKNREFAMQRLRAKLYELQLNEQIAESDATRKSQVRSNFRNEKIRTYNYSQDRITDHRLQGSNMHNLKNFLTGGEALDNLINRLHSTTQEEKLIKILSSIDS